jgi:colanic acid biosynthesis glycosyl transferase WcaI
MSEEAAMSRMTESASSKKDTTVRQRWLILTQYYPPEIGAPQIRLRCLVRELRRHGKEVSVITAMPNYPAGKIFDKYKRRIFYREQIDGVDVRRTWVYAATGRAAWARLLNYCSFAATALAVVLFGQRPDVIFLEAQPLPLGIVGLLMKYLRGVPYIYNVPDLQVDVARELGFLRKPFLLKLAERAESLFLRKAWKVSTVTHRFIEHFKSRGIPPGQITFLPNGADTEFLVPSEPDLSYMNEWRLDGKTVVAYVGTHAYYHGLDTLVRAAELLSDDPRIVLVMVGNGPERERIRNLAAEKRLTNIIFATVPYEGMSRLYSVVHAAVATLRNVPVAKGMRLSKVFPALSCGVPVIYSGQGEAAELLARHECGLTAPPEDPGSLADAIRELSCNVELRQRLGRNGRRLVESEYSWSTIVDRWLREIDRQEMSTPSALCEATTVEPVN